MNPVISREYVDKNYIHKDKIREIKEKIYNELDGNGITRAYQLNVDKYFNELLEKTEDESSKKNYIHKDKLKKIKQSIDVLRNADGCPIIKLDMAMYNIVKFYDELLEVTEDDK